MVIAKSQGPVCLHTIFVNHCFYITFGYTVITRENLIYSYFIQKDYIYAYGGKKLKTYFKSIGIGYFLNYKNIVIKGLKIL